MKKLKILITLIPIILTSNPSLTWTDSTTGLKYDFSQLHRNPDNPWSVMDGGDTGFFSMTYYFNFGESHNKKCKEQNVAVTEVLNVLSELTDTCEILGKTESRNVYLIDNTKPYLGIYVEYGDGDLCTNSEDITQNNLPRKTRFKLLCSKEQNNFEIDLPGNTQGTTKCLMEFKINTPAGCPGGVYPGFKSTVTLFWIIIIFTIYILIGFMYNVNQNNLSGKEAIPNIEFWRVFPYYVMDGFSFCFGLLGNGVNWVKMKFTKENSGYSDI
jgi:hypothetical protein